MSRGNWQNQEVTITVNSINTIANQLDLSGTVIPLALGAGLVNGDVLTYLSGPGTISLQPPAAPGWPAVLAVNATSGVNSPIISSSVGATLQFDAGIGIGANGNQPIAFVGTAIGGNSQASTVDATVVGEDSNDGGATGCTIFGFDCSATANEACLFGNMADGGGFSFGKNAFSVADNSSMAFGSGARSNGAGGISFGYTATSSIQSLVFGGNANDNSNTQSCIFGHNASVTGATSVASMAFGFNSSASGTISGNATAFGTGSQALDDFTSVFGPNAQAMLGAVSASAFGSGATVSNSAASAFGAGASSSGAGGLALGSGSSDGGQTGSTALGTSAVCNAANQCRVVGDLSLQGGKVYTKTPPSPPVITANLNVSAVGITADSTDSTGNINFAVTLPNTPWSITVTYNSVYTGTANYPILIPTTFGLTTAAGYVAAYVSAWDNTSFTVIGSYNVGAGQVYYLNYLVVGTNT